MSSRDVAGHRPGYLVVQADDRGTYVGGLMVTDTSGLPVDFRFTDPVTPTRLQRALYGGVLDRYLRTEVVLRTLFDALEQPPSLLIVDDATLLDEPIDLCPLAFVGPSGSDAIGPPGTRSSSGQGANTLLLQVGGTGHPLRVTLPAASEHEPLVVETLLALSERMDVLEPLERVRDALGVIVAEGAVS
jgi:hypothetical protein